MRAVDIRHKVDVQPFLGVRFEGFGDHHRAEIGTANSDVHYVSNAFARVASPGAAPNSITKGLHVLEDGIHLGHDILAIDHDGAIGTVAQRDVKHSTLLSDIELLPV